MHPWLGTQIERAGIGLACDRRAETAATIRVSALEAPRLMSPKLPSQPKIKSSFLETEPVFSTGQEALGRHSGEVT